MELYIQISYQEIQNILTYHREYIRLENSSTAQLEIEGINMTLLKNAPFIFLKVDVPELLNKSAIIEKDIATIMSRLNLATKAILYYEHAPVLKRYDFRLDVKVKDIKERELLFKLYEKTRTKLYTMNKYPHQKYKGKSLYFKSPSKYASTSLNIYDKGKERQDKNLPIRGYEKDVIRYEIQLRNRHLNYNNNRKNMPKEIDTYLNTALMDWYYHKYIKPIFFSGHYYNIYHAEKIICKYINNETNRNKILDFLKLISRKDVQTAKSFYSGYLYKKNITLLEGMNINPILIPKHYGVPFLKNPLHKFLKDGFNFCTK